MGEAVGIASLVLSLGTSLASANQQARAGKQSLREAELTAQTEELAATQREGDRKERLAKAMATANAQAGAAGIAAFEGSPLTILQESIRNEETATERDRFNARISALTTRARGESARSTARVGAATTLARGLSSTAQLIPEA